MRLLLISRVFDGVLMEVGDRHQARGLVDGTCLLVGKDSDIVEVNHKEVRFPMQEPYNLGFCEAHGM